MTDMIPRAEADALAAAAFEAAEKICDDERYNTNMLTSNPPQSASAVGARNRIRALTPADARSTIEAMLADAEKRGEKRGMLRAAEIAQKRARIVEHPDNELKMTHRAHALIDPSRIAAAIRAEAGE